MNGTVSKDGQRKTVSTGKKISRMKMKAISCKLGYQIKKIFDDNHCQVNTYNVNVFKEYFNKCE